MVRGTGWLTGLLCLVGAVLTPSLARAQAGAYATPSLTTAEVYDDNVFSAPSNPPPASAGGVSAFNREDDFITRFSPGLRAGYKSEPFTLLADYGIDADVYSRHSKLTSFPARQQAALSLRYLPAQRLTLELRGVYRDTDTARDLNLFQLLDPHGGTALFTATNLDTGRVSAREYSASPAVEYRLSRVLDAAASYAFQRTEQTGSTNESQVANASLSWAVNRNHSLRGGYSVSRFTFDDQRQVGGQSSASKDVTTHTLPLGWTYRVTHLLDLSLQAGPRFSDGSVDADATATASYQLEGGSLSLAYFRRQGTTVGRGGVVTSDTAAAGLSYDITRRLGVGTGFTFSRNALETSDVDVYQTTLGVVYRLTEWLSLTVSHQFWFQEEHFNDRSSISAAGRWREQTYHNFALVGVRASSSWRIDAP